jgi:hypothetical protein
VFSLSVIVDYAADLFTTQLKEQAAQIQRVSAQLAAASPSGGGLELNKFAKAFSRP